MIVQAFFTVELPGRSNKWPEDGQVLTNPELRRPWPGWWWGASLPVGTDAVPPPLHSLQLRGRALPSSANTHPGFGASGALPPIAMERPTACPPGSENWGWKEQSARQQHWPLDLEDYEEQRPCSRPR